MKFSNHPIRIHGAQLLGLLVGLVVGTLVGIIVALVFDGVFIAIPFCAGLGAVIGQGLSMPMNPSQNEIDLGNEVEDGIFRYLLYVFIGAAVGISCGALVGLVLHFGQPVWPFGFWLGVGFVLGALLGLGIGVFRRTGPAETEDVLDG